jgi:hypothetical protein
MKKFSVNHFPKHTFCSFSALSLSLLSFSALSQLSLSAAPDPDPMRQLMRSVRSSDSVTADDIMDGGDGDFTVKIAVEISTGIVLRLQLWMAVGPRGAWERSDGGDGDFMVEIAVEISPGIVLRSQLWMAVGPKGAWERSDGGDGEEKAVGPCSYVVEDLSEKSTSVDRTVEEEEEENERCEKKSMDR